MKKCICKQYLFYFMTFPTATYKHIKYNKRVGNVYLEDIILPT